MEKFAEVVEYAIRLEVQSISLYTGLHAKAKRSEIKEVFLEMIKQEESHKKKLENILKKHSLPEGKKYYPDADLKIADYVVDVDPNSNFEDLAYDEALIIGMKMEQATLSLYQDLAQKSSDQEIKELFKYLADEEARHKHSFEEKFDDLH